MNPLEKIGAALQVAQLVTAGQYLQAARLAVELGLDLVPVDTLKGYLDDAAAARASAIADAAEAAKVGLP